MDRKRQDSRIGDHVTLYGAAQQLGLTYWQIYRLVHKRSVPTVKIGHTLMVRLSDVEIAAK